MRGRPRYSWAARYGVAAVALALAFLIQALLDPHVQGEMPFLLLSAPVLVGAAFGGFGPGVFATLSGALIGDYFFLSPRGTLMPPDPAHALRTGLFLAQGLAISAVGAWLTSARRRARERRESLRESEDRYRSLVEAAKDYAIFMLDTEGRVSDWNEGARRLFGYEEGEIVGEPGSVLFTPEDRRAGAPEEELRKAAEEGRAKDERWHVRKDGTRFFTSGFTRPVWDEEGNLVGFAKVARDITERKETEEALRQSEERYRQIVETASEGIWVIDAHGKTQYANRRMAEMLGCKAKEDMLGRYAFDFLYETDRAEAERMLERRKLGAGERTEFRLRREDGSELWVLSSTRPILNENGGLVAVLGMMTDITERKRTEEALREIREAERSRMARDLHDGPLQDLTYGLAEAQIAKMLSQDPEQLEDRLGRGIEALLRAVQGLRDSVYDLHAYAHQDQSAQRLLGSLVELNRRRAPQIRIDLDAQEGFFEGVSERERMELLRIVQEALTNARRHSGARNVRVALRIEGDEVVAEVADDGRGFDAEAPAGVGLRSMRERAAALGGDLEVECEPGQGTTVRVRVLLRVLPSGERGERRV